MTDPKIGLLATQFSNPDVENPGVLEPALVVYRYMCKYVNTFCSCLNVCSFCYGLCKAKHGPKQICPVLQTNNIVVFIVIHFHNDCFGLFIPPCGKSPLLVISMREGRQRGGGLTVAVGPWSGCRPRGQASIALLNKQPALIFSVWLFNCFYSILFYLSFF